MEESPIKVGMIADQTGALSFMGIADANVAKMVIDDINASGGVLGRRVDLYLEDGATTDSVAEAAATKLVEQDEVDVIFGGIYSSTRQAIKGPAVVKGKKLYIYPEQYEGQECDPLIFCTGPVPAQQVEPLLPWLMQQTGAKKFYLPSADYIWPHILNQSAREVVTANGGEIVGEEYFPLDHTDYANTVDKIMSNETEVVFNTIVPPGLTPFLQQLLRRRVHEAGWTHRLHLLRRELPEPGAGRTGGGSLQLPRLLPGRERSLQQGAARAVRPALSGQRQVHCGQWVLRPVPRAEAVGGRGEGGGLAPAGSGHQGTGPREHRPGAGWCRGDGARSTSRPNEHVHRPGEQRHVQDRQEPGCHRSEGVLASMK